MAARTSEHARTGALTTLSSAFGLGTIMGPALAPFFILPLVGLSGPMFGFAGIAFLVLLAVRRLLPDDDPMHRAAAGRAATGAAASMPTLGGGPTGATTVAAVEGRAARLSVLDARVFPFLLFGFAMGNVQAATSQTLGFLIIDQSHLTPKLAQPLIATAFMAGAGATLLAQWGLIRMLDMSSRQLLQWGAGLAAAGTALIAVAGDYHGIVLGLALASVGYGFARPGFTAGSSLAVSRHEQGAVAGAVTAVNGAAYIVAPTIGIALYEFAPRLPYWSATVLLLLLCAYTLLDPTLRRAGRGD